MSLRGIYIFKISEVCLEEPKHALTILNYWQMNGRDPKLETYEYANSVVLKRRTKSAVLAQELYRDPFNHPQHNHERACFIVTDNVQLKEKIGSKTLIHTPKSIVWRPGGFSHADSMAESNGRCFSIWLTKESLETFASYAKVPDEFSEKNTHLTAISLRLMREFRNWSDSSLLITEGLVLEILGHATRKAVEREKAPPPWLNRVVEKLEDEFTEKHTNVSLAAEAGIHPVYLARVFRKFFGCSIGEHLKSKRVYHARQLLVDSKLSLAAIAYTSGFSDQSQFTRAFKEVVGITPGAFRDELEGR